MDIIYQEIQRQITHVLNVIVVVLNALLLMIVIYVVMDTIDKEIQRQITHVLNVIVVVLNALLLMIVIYVVMDTIDKEIQRQIIHVLNATVFALNVLLLIFVLNVQITKHQSMEIVDALMELFYIIHHVFFYVPLLHTNQIINAYHVHLNALHALRLLMIAFLLLLVSVLLMVSQLNANKAVSLVLVKITLFYVFLHFVVIQTILFNAQRVVLNVILMLHFAHNALGGMRLLIVFVPNAIQVVLIVMLLTL